jgi:phage shock protein A
MKIFESIKRWFSVKKNVTALKIDNATQQIIDENLIDLVNGEIITSKSAFNENCHRAAEFNVSVSDFERELNTLKKKYQMYETTYKDKLYELKQDVTNESLRTKLSQMLITKNQMSEEIKMKETAYENLRKEQKNLENTIRKQKMMLAENNAKAELLKAKKHIIDMYKKMDMNIPEFETKSYKYLNRLDKEIKIDDELKALTARICPEADIENDIESFNINKMLDDELAKLN